MWDWIAPLLFLIGVISLFLSGYALWEVNKSVAVGKKIRDDNIRMVYEDQTKEYFDLHQQKEELKGNKTFVN